MKKTSIILFQASFISGSNIHENNFQVGSCKRVLNKAGEAMKNKWKLL